MASAQGTATLTFPAVGGKGANEASVAVTGQTTISATSKVESFVMSDDTTATHTANDHRWVGDFLNLTCGTPTAGTGFTIYGKSTQKLSGTFQCRWVWSD